LRYAPMFFVILLLYHIFIHLSRVRILVHPKNQDFPQSHLLNHGKPPVVPTRTFVGCHSFLNIL